MLDYIRTENPYEPDYFKIDEKKVFAITSKNASFMEAIVRMDSRYYREQGNYPPNKDFSPFGDVKNAKGRYCGSSEYWFSEMKKGARPFDECVLGAVIAIDSSNSTHLEASRDGRLLMQKRICQKTKNTDELINMLKKPFANKDRSHLISVLTEKAEGVKEGEERYNISFASKFCAYASRALLGECRFAKYDDIVSSALPQYAFIYLQKDFPKTYFKISNEKCKKKDSETRLQHRLDTYWEYADCIMGIIDSVEEKVSLEEFDHIIWYGYK